MIRATWYFTHRLLSWTLILGLLLFALTVLGLRYWVLPNIGDYRSQIAAAMTRAIGVPSTLGTVEASWDGLRPHLKFSDISLQDERSRKGLALTELEGTVSWWALLVGELQFHSLEIKRPELTVRRDKDGALHVAGIKMGKKTEDQGGGFGDWLLAQDEVFIRDAVVTWHDELRGAPELKFNGVALRLENSGSRHLLGFTATPPTELAAPIDVRAEVHGRSLIDLNAWSGRVYARMDTADVAAWRTYLPVPKEVEKGIGGVQVWLDFDGTRISDVSADVQLNDVATRLKPELPLLSLASLGGRLGYRDLLPGFNLTGKHLDFTLANSRTNIPEADYFFHYVPASDKRAAEGELLASALDVEALRLVADSLPFDATHRKRMDQMAPKGRLENLSIKWGGDVEAPKTYAAKVKFNNFSVAPSEALPGISGMNGDFNASESGGTLSLSNKASEVKLPKVFAEPLKFDSLVVQSSWKRTDDKWEVDLQNINFANADAAGNLSGKYSTQPNSPGMADIKANLLRVEARDVYRYLPVTLGEGIRNWLQHALKAGKAENVALTLKGNLRDFPFEHDKNGQFRVSAKLSNAEFDYSDAWPKVEKLQADLLFAGKRMEIHSRDAMIANTKINKLDVAIPDLFTRDALLELTGNISGAVADKIRFLNTSPVNSLLDGFTQGMQASGNGVLDLKMDMPLSHTRDTKTSGEYHFQNNHIEGGKLWPPLDNVTGTLAFGATGVQVQGLTATAFGGPVNINVKNQPGGALVVDAGGKANIDDLLSVMNIPAQDWMDGTTDWRVNAQIEKGNAAIKFDSDLLGVKSELPEPLRKAAAASMPLHVERKTISNGQEQYEVSLGKEISGVFLRTQNDKGEWSMRRGTLALNTNATLQARDGVYVTGALDTLDLDRWRTYLRKTARPAAAAEMAPVGLSLYGFDLTVTKLTALDKLIGVTRVNAERVGTAWESTIISNDMNGTLTWKPEGHGTIIARFKNFIIPESAETDPADAKAVPSTEAALTEADFPALDIVAEQFQVRKRVLGKLEVVAKPEARNWRLEKLKLTLPNATLNASGLWQVLPGKPSTTLDMKLEVANAGKFLGQLGTPDAVKGAPSTISGKLSWAGNPYEFNPKILSGNFKLEARGGQFLKLQPGAPGKLLSLMSLQALPRRITLDFRDVFSEGFAFDDMAGSFVIDKGVMSTSDFVINGTAAIVTMEGTVNLGAETESLKVKVIPAASETVSIASTLLGGPVVGLVSYALQKLLKNPFGQIASYQYAITGTWDEPHVDKIQQQPVQQPSGWE